MARGLLVSTTLCRRNSSGNLKYQRFAIVVWIRYVGDIGKNAPIKTPSTNDW